MASLAIGVVGRYVRVPFSSVQPVVMPRCHAQTMAG